MNNIHMLVKELHDIIAQESTTSVEILSSYIVGELLGDYDGKYADLYANNTTVKRIGDLAGDLETSNGSTNQLLEMWNELKGLVQLLEQEDR